MAAAPSARDDVTFAPVVPAAMFECGEVAYGTDVALPPNLLVSCLLCLGDFEAPGPTSGDEAALVAHLRHLGYPLRRAVLRKYATDRLVSEVARSSSSTLAVLDACYSTASNAGLQRLFSLTQLRELRLAQCYGVTDTVLTAGLPRLEYLETLDLSFCRQVSVAALRALKSLRSLRRLLLNGCDGLGEAEFGAPPADADGGDCTTVYEVLAECAPALTSLSLNVNEGWVTDAGVSQLALSMPALRVLHLKGSTALTATGLAGLSPLSGTLEVLELAECPRISDAAVKALGCFRRLRVLDLAFTRTGNAGIQELDGVLSLRHLNVWGTAVTEAGAEGLRGTPDLVIQSNRFAWRST